MINGKLINESDAFRNVFNSLMRGVHPYFNGEFGYYSDVLYDAAQLAQLDIGESAYVMIRDCGTHYCPFVADVTQAESFNTEWKATLKFTRGKYDNFIREIHKEY